MNVPNLPEDRRVLVGLGLLGAVAGFLVARSRVLRALLLLVGGGALVRRLTNRPPTWHDVPPPQ